MLRRLLIVLLTITTLSFVTASLHPSHAAVLRRSNLHYSELVKLFVLTREQAMILTPPTRPTITNPLTTGTPTDTPTITPTPKISATSTTAPTPTVAPTVKPTVQPTVKSTSKPTVTTAPTPTPTKKPSPTPTPVTAATTPPTSVPDTTTYMINEINKYRSSLGLYAVKTSAETCTFAATRAKEISTSFDHDGFNSRSSNHTLPYTSWTRVTENIAMTSKYTDVVNLWINSPGHAANMRSDTPYVCVQQYGNYYAYEGMKP